MQIRQRAVRESGRSLRRRTPDVCILSLLLSAGALASPALAQQAGGDSGDDFCALAATDLLAALDGSWTVNHGGGTAVGETEDGIIAIPFPSPPAGKIIFKYAPDRGVIDARSPDGFHHMLVLPTPDKQEPAASLIVGEPPAGETSTAGCDWYALPTLIGSNHFFTTTDGSFRAESTINALRTVLQCDDKGGKIWDFNEIEGYCLELEALAEDLEVFGGGVLVFRGLDG